MWKRTLIWLLIGISPAALGCSDDSGNNDADASTDTDTDSATDTDVDTDTGTDTDTYTGTDTDSDTDTDADTDTDTDADTDSDTDTEADGGTGSFSVRIMAANLTSGTGSSYDPGHGTRIFQGLNPDIVMIQEFNFGENTEVEIRSFVDTAFGMEFYYYQETLAPAVSLPNGVISRYPILDAGEWTDPKVDNRSFAWARIDLPGDTDLLTVSVHLLTTSATNRAEEAAALVAYLDSHAEEGEYVVIGGDFNTNSRTETCITEFSSVVNTSADYPVDNDGNDNTNANRDEPYDWLLANSKLDSRLAPLVIQSSSFPDGLVFDSRVYSPLADVLPVEYGDSAASGMQHMAVLKDFLLPGE